MSSKEESLYEMAYENALSGFYHEAFKNVPGYMEQFSKAVHIIQTTGVLDAVEDTRVAFDIEFQTPPIKLGTAHIPPIVKEKAGVKGKIYAAAVIGTVVYFAAFGSEGFEHPVKTFQETKRNVLATFKKGAKK